MRDASVASGWGISIVARNLLDGHAPFVGTSNVNRQTDELERFLTLGWQDPGPKANGLPIARP